MSQKSPLDARWIVVFYPASSFSRNTLPSSTNLQKAREMNHIGFDLVWHSRKICEAFKEDIFALIKYPPTIICRSHFFLLLPCSSVGGWWVFAHCVCACILCMCVCVCVVCLRQHVHVWCVRACLRQTAPCRYHLLSTRGRHTASLRSWWRT